MTIESFKGRVAVVTGGASGIGRGIARALASEQAAVAVVDVDGDGAAAVAAELNDAGAKAAPFELDVRDDEAVDALPATVRAALGPVEILCNNAGVYLGGNMEEATFDDWQFIQSINLDGAYRVGQVFWRDMVADERRGHIVNTASIGGFLSDRRCLAYCVSKFGIVAYSDALRTHLADYGIGVSTLAPGPIATGLPGSDRLRRSGDAAGGESAHLDTLITDGMDPDEVGPMVVAGIRRNAPYIFTHDLRASFVKRFDEILAEFDHVTSS